MAWTDSGSQDRSDTSWKEALAGSFSDDLDGIMEHYASGWMDEPGALFRICESGCSREQAERMFDLWLERH